MTERPVAITPRLRKAVVDRLARSVPVRRTLPGGGRLHVDRQLPFLLVYRRPDDRDDAGTENLVKSAASYLIAPWSPDHRAGLRALVRDVITTLEAQFGAFLVVEVWAAADGGKANDPAVPSVLPQVAVHAAAARRLTPSVEALARRLGKLRVEKHGVTVDVRRGGTAHPPGMKSLLGDAPPDRCSFIGVAVPPVYRKMTKAGVKFFPLIMRALRRNVDLAVRQAAYEFAHSCTTQVPRHYHELGRRAVVKAVWDVDRQLGEVSSSFDYLVSLTPVNAKAALAQFRSDRFERAPELHYRPLPIDPGAVKHQLYGIPIDRVEDPALQRVFREKQEELDLKITMLRDRDTPRFVHESLQLFGAVEDDLLELAKDLLDRLSKRRRGRKGKGKERERVGAKEFARRAEADFERYRETLPEFSATARVKTEVTGLMVSRGHLLIDDQLSVAPSRVEALLAHEVGTHLLTYYNGRSQPFKQLRTGLAGYEALQEGLAVLSEYLVGGLDRGRLRLLAARVVAARLLVDGASFVDTFRVLEGDLGFTPRAAFGIAVRIFRGGGLTKDVVYLRGLQALLRYIRGGGDLATLFVGKIAEQHVPLIRELQYREVLAPAALEPLHMATPGARRRLAALAQGDGSVAALVSEDDDESDA